MGQPRKGRRRFPVPTSVRWWCSPTVGLCSAWLKGWWLPSLCESFYQSTASLKLLQVALSVVFSIATYTNVIEFVFWGKQLSIVAKSSWTVNPEQLYVTSGWQTVSIKQNNVHIHCKLHTQTLNKGSTTNIPPFYSASLQVLLMFIAVLYSEMLYSENQTVFLIFFSPTSCTAKEDWSRLAKKKNWAEAETGTRRQASKVNCYIGSHGCLIEAVPLCGPSAFSVNQVVVIFQQKSRSTGNFLLQVADWAASQ